MTTVGFTGSGNIGVTIARLAIGSCSQNAPLTPTSLSSTARRATDASLLL